MLRSTFLAFLVSVLFVTFSYSNVIDYLETLDDFSAEFTQKTVASDGLTQSGKGELFVSRAAQATVWEYNQPERQKYLIRNNQLWLYVYEEQELTIGALEDGHGLDFAQLSRASLANQYAILEETGTQLRLETLREPKMKISIELRGGKLHQVLIESATKEVTTLEFQQVLTNQILGDAIFEPVIPAGWEVIRQ